jgi:ATP-dependent Zn protease
MTDTPRSGLKSRPKDSERPTRKPMRGWDRIKVFVFLIACFFALVWASMAGDQLNNVSTSFREAFREAVQSYWWLLALAGLEVIRQLHYVLAESSPAYHSFWKRVFGRWERRSSTWNAWTKFRVMRVVKFLFFLLIVSLLISAFSSDPRITPWNALVVAPALIVTAMPLVFQLAFGFLFGMLQFLGIFYLLTRGGVETLMPDDIDTRFSDVWGQDHVMEKVRENIMFLEDPASIEDRGGHVPKGILLWGPPGTGKTLMAQAMAGETERPFVFVEPGAFVNMFFGIGILKMYMLWRKLRKLALRYGGVIAFFDEADSLGNRGAAVGGEAGAAMRPGESSVFDACNGLAYQSDIARSLVVESAARSTDAGAPRSVKDGIIMGGMGMGRGDIFALQRLLTEMDGLKKPRGFFNRRIRRLLGMRPKPPPNYRILVILATNMPQTLDQALLRPGRIDRMYRVGYTSKEGRMRTYEGYFGKVSHSLDRVQIEKLAVITPYYSGAKMKDIVNESLINAIRNGRDSIEWIDVIQAKHLKELGPPEDVNYIDRERHAIAIHEACHAVAAYRERRHLSIDIASIEKGSGYLGVVVSVKPEDLYTTWKSEFEADIVVSLASLAGERMFFFGDNSSGVSGDLASATYVATGMESRFGMGRTIGVLDVLGEAGLQPGRPAGEKPTKDKLPDTMSQRIEERLDAVYQRTWALLERNRKEILAVAHALEVHKTLAGEDVIAVIEGIQGPLVDGRPYHDPAFQAALETYHARAAAAHDDHAEVDDSMPVLVPTPPIPVDLVGAGGIAAAGNGRQRSSDGSVVDEDPPPPRRD